MCISETSKYRHLTLPYCKGNGIDIGAGGDPVIPTSIQIESVNQYTPRNGKPIQLVGDGTNLCWFQDKSLDYVYSSHLIEDFLDWTPVLKEWCRVIKTGGYLVLLLPEKGRWHMALKRGQPPNLAHKHEGEIGELSLYIKEIPTFEVIEDRFTTPEDPTDYSILFVARRIIKLG